MSLSINGRSGLVRTGMAAIAGMLAISAMPVMAAHEDLEFPVAIHAGTCEEPGEEIVALDNLVRLPEGTSSEGERAGAAGSQVVHGTTDDAEISLTIEDLFAADHILAVFDAEGETIVACGPIGAYTYQSGDDLVFGLRSQGESPYSGVAIIDGDDEDDDNSDDDTDIDIYLVNNTPAPAPAATPVG
jgi:hypothetical protein